MTDPKPQVGTAMIITKDDKVLLIKRKGPHGKGTWSTPGGHLDFGETPEQCAARETKEEVGLDVANIRFRALTNDIFEATGKHYITIWMDAGSTGEPFIAAEREVSEIGWFPWEALPSPLFLPLENLVKKNSYPPK
ncbi:MAG: nucleotide triphosphate diphosphatase NUDT15 [Chloroflexota bacterium]|nr:NUDIX domain-containing protein [Anaerolineales bacterium]